MIDYDGDDDNDDDDDDDDDDDGDSPSNKEDRTNATRDYFQHKICVGFDIEKDTSPPLTRASCLRQRESGVERGIELKSLKLMLGVRQAKKMISHWNA